MASLLRHYLSIIGVDSRIVFGMIFFLTKAFQPSIVHLLSSPIFPLSLFVLFPAMLTFSFSKYFPPFPIPFFYSYTKEYFPSPFFFSSTKIYVPPLPSPLQKKILTFSKYFPPFPSRFFFPEAKKNISLDKYSPYFP